MGGQLAAMGRSLRTAWTAGRRIERTAYLVSAVLFASGVLHVGVFLLDGGPWQGPVSFRKAVTFGLSFGLTLATVTWVSTWLRMGERARRAVLTAFAIACVTEVALITMQAWRKVPSHFNFRTGFDAATSMTLAAGGGVIVVSTIVWTVAAVRTGDEVTPSMRLALRFGFGSLLAALAVGAAMIAKGTIAARTGNPELAYTTAGSLKPAHAAPMHAVLVLPALAWLLTFTGWAERLRLRVVWLGVAGYLLLAGVVMVETFAGTSPLAAPAAADLLAGLGTVLLVGAGVLALYGVVRVPAAAAVSTRPARTA